MKIIDRDNPRFHRCFSMEITAKPIGILNWILKLRILNWILKWKKRKYQLFLTLAFNDKHEEVVDRHKLQIGLNGGELNLKLHQAQMKQSDIDMMSKMEFNRKKEEEAKLRETGEFGFSSGASSSNLPPPLSWFANFSAKRVSDKTTTSKFTTMDSLVSYTYESPTSISWFFKSQTVLRESCRKESLGIIELTEYPCCVIATFKISPKDISFVEVKNSRGKIIHTNDSPPNKLAVIRKRLEAQIGINKHDFHVRKLELEIES